MPANSNKLPASTIRAQNAAKKAKSFDLVLKYVEGIDRAVPGRGGFNYKHQAAIDEIIRRMDGFAKAEANAAKLLSSLQDVIVWQETFDRGECRRNDLDEALSDARKLIEQNNA